MVKYKVYHFKFNNPVYSVLCSHHFLNIKGAAVVSDSVRPHRRQPTRLPCPWDSPGKNTGVGCHFLIQCMKLKSQSEVAQSCATPSDPMDCSPPDSSVHGIFQARVLEWGAIAFSEIGAWIYIWAFYFVPLIYISVFVLCILNL